MSDTKKPVRTQDLHVDIDAPLETVWEALTTGPGLANWFAPIGEVSAPGLGATVKAGWSEEMMMTNVVDAWEPLQRVGWLDEGGWMGPGTSMAVEYQLSTVNGKTRVRLVQSAFGASEGWDDLFDGTKTGWTYFLYNLREVCERHQGRTRRLISERLAAPIPRASMWKHLLGGGLLRAKGSELAQGDDVAVTLGGAPLAAVVEVLVPQHGIGLRIPALGDALLFIELEGKSDAFSIGYWLSVYDPAMARSIEAGARDAFKGAHASAQA